MGIEKFKAQSEKRKVKTETLKLFVLSFSFALFAFSFTLSCFAADKAALVREGNQLYNKGNIDEALKGYNKALTSAPEAPLINFNIGNAFYRKSQYTDAVGSYEKALLSPDKKTEAKANYNIGNCKFRQGRLKESSDLAGAIAEYRQSLDYYKRAMELGPDDKDAKFNHEFVEKYLKSLLDKQKKNEEKKGQEGQQAEQQKEQQQAQQAQEVKPPEQKGQQQQYEVPKDRHAEEPHEKDTSFGAGGDIAKEDKGPDKEISKEEAGMLLDDSRQQEQQERQIGEKQAPMRYPDVEKDW